MSLIFEKKNSKIKLKEFKNKNINWKFSFLKSLTIKVKITPSAVAAVESSAAASRCQLFPVVAVGAAAAVGGRC